MKIALFVHCFFPDHFYGTETYTLELARNLKSCGHDPVVVSAVFPGEPQNKKEITRYEYQEIPVYCIDKNYFPDRRIKDTYYQPALRGLFRDLLGEIKPDLVHVTHLINHTAVLLEITRELNIPAMATFTDFFGFCFNNKLEGAGGSLCHGPDRYRTNCLACFLKAQGQNPGATRLQKLTGIYPLSKMTAAALNILRRVPGFRKGKLAGLVLDITRRPDILAACYSHYEAVIAPTKFLRNAYIANGLQTPVYLSHFGVDLPRREKPSREAAAPIKFGFIGQIAAHKGVDILVKAFREVPRGSAELHIYGPENQDPGYVSDLKRMVASSEVFFRGTFPKEQMTHVLSELDFLVIPSTWYENSPLVLLNALASHTPVIISDVEGMTEFVEDGKNGYVFKRGSVQDLMRVLKEIVKNPEKARAMSDRTEYPRSIRMMVGEVVEVYKLLGIDEPLRKEVTAKTIGTKKSDAVVMTESKVCCLHNSGSRKEAHGK